MLCSGVEDTRSFQYRPALCVFRNLTHQLGVGCTLHEKSGSDDHHRFASGNMYLIAMAEGCHLAQCLTVFVTDLSGFTDCFIRDLMSGPLFYLFAEQVHDKFIPLLVHLVSGKQPVNECKRRKVLLRFYTVQFS